MLDDLTIKRMTDLNLFLLEQLGEGLISPEELDKAFGSKTLPDRAIVLRPLTQEEAYLLYTEVSLEMAIQKKRNGYMRKGYTKWADAPGGVFTRFLMDRPMQCATIMCCAAMEEFRGDARLQEKPYGLGIGVSDDLLCIVATEASMDEIPAEMRGFLEQLMQKAASSARATSMEDFDLEMWKPDPKNFQ